MPTPHQPSAGPGFARSWPMAPHPLEEVDCVLEKLDWMHREHIWPNGKRYLWTDAFGLVLLLSLHQRQEDGRYLAQAEELVADVERVLGRAKGLRIGEAADRDGQYFHYLAMWLFALSRLGDILPKYRERGVALAHDIHKAFVIPTVGVIWKMREDLSGPYPGYGLGAMDAYDGYVAYKRLDPEALAGEIAEMKALIDRDFAHLRINQDLGLGMMLWLAHFFPGEPWAQVQTRRSLQALDDLWIDPPGYFCRAQLQRHTKFAFTNYGVSLGLQAAGRDLDRVRRLNTFFEAHRSEDDYDTDAITHVMACTSRFPGLFLDQPSA